MPDGKTTGRPKTLACFIRHLSSVIPDCTVWQVEKRSAGGVSDGAGKPSRRQPEPAQPPWQPGRPRTQASQENQSGSGSLTRPGDDARRLSGPTQSIDPA